MARKGRRRAKGDGALFRRGDGRWQGEVLVRYDGDGKPEYKVTTAKTQEACREKLERLKKERDAGTLRVDKLLVADFLKLWLEEKGRRVKPRTHHDYCYDVEKYINPRIGKLELSKVTALVIQNMLNDIADTVSADRANKVRRELYGAFRLAVKWRQVAYNPVEAIDPFKHERKPMCLWQPDEAVRFIECSRTHRLFPLFYLAMSTGLRRGELLGLRWQDIEGSTIHIRQSYIRVGNELVFTTPKTTKGVRRVAVSKDMLEILAVHCEKQETERTLAGKVWTNYDLVFTSEVGTPVDPDNLKRVRYELMERAGVPRIRLHDLRHLHASLMIKGGADPKLLADRLGHARASFTLDVYTHLFDEQRQAAAVSLLDLLPSKSNEEPN